MAGDFSGLSIETISQWPPLNTADPLRRNWYPAFSIALASLSFVMLAARLSVQCRKIDAPRINLDDVLASAAFMFSVGFTVLSVLGTIRYGFDRHIWDVHSDQYSRAALIEWLTEATFLLSTCLTKISVLSFYRRLDPPCTKAVRRIVYGFMLLTLAYTLAFLLYQSLFCRPLTSYWMLPDRNHLVRGSCASQRLSLPLQGSFSSFSTLYSTIIPFLVLRNLPMAMAQRWGLRITTMAGLAVMGAGIARTYFLACLVNSFNGDATWNGFNVFVCSQLESQLAIICASAPFLLWYLLAEPNVPVTRMAYKQRNDSVITRVSSSLSGQLKRSLHIRQSSNLRPVEISAPQAVEIPEWEFVALRGTPRASSPVDVNSYNLYLAGHFGPPPPPKDSRDLFEQYRREHGMVV
ncbi:hypothetical protein BCR34DRAFT_272103 [Clohesyomyces aquaticus]|uniref:Rhodopsin domain-containing protein n=1 Tax=Clohesyomyces aquaticus TaxID=1231657 RepID=A0A1Y1ZT74_9PLEO|nr:hypothetical protein BCR34DRAFT_272103 [Clohesyomyces aquaticus]